MSIEIITLIVLLAMFIVGSVISVNMGIIGIVAAFVVGTYASGLSVKEIYAAFPIDMFFLLAGVTYLFAIAQNNRTLDLLLVWGLRLVRGNVGLLPWVLFGVCAILASMGASSAAIAPIFFPIGLRLAYQYGINPILMGLMLSTGIYAGSFSPLNVFGLVVNGIMESENIAHSPVIFYINTLVFYVLISIIIFVAYGGIRLVKSNNDGKALVAAALHENQAAAAAGQQGRGFTWYNAVTLFGIGVLIVMALVFDMNMGFGAFVVGLALALLAPKQQTDVIKQMPWSVIMMVTGIMTYVGVMDQVGTLDYLTDLIARVGNPLLASLIASYIGGIISAFASTTGFLTAVIPLAAPILQDPSMSAVGVVSSIAISASVVDISPFSTIGALMLANVQGVNERLFFRKLLLTSALFIALGPGLAWLIYVLIGTPW